MEEKKMVVKNKNKKRTKEKKKEEGKKGGISLKSKGKVGKWKEKKIKPTSMFGWFRLNGLGSSQNDQNNFIHN